MQIGANAFGVQGDISKLPDSKNRGTVSSSGGRIGIYSPMLRGIAEADSSTDGRARTRR